MSATESSASPCASQAIIAAVEAPDGARFGGRLCGNRARLKYLARRLRALGERPVFECLHEIECGADLRERLERYAWLDPDVVEALGGSHFGPPVFVIEGGRRP
jgi:hypothetical protein